MRKPRSPQSRAPRPRFNARPPDDDLVRVAGLPSVSELFRSSPERVERLYFDAALKVDVQPWLAVLARRHKVYRQLPDEEMQRVAGTTMHGGIVALARPRPIRPLDVESAAGWAGAGAPLLLLDGVGNPQNIGAIARTAAFFGFERMVLSDHPGQAGLSDASYRVAKGGLDRLDIFSATRFADTLKRLGAHYHVVGTALGKGVGLDDLGQGSKPVALVLGNEEEGLSAATLGACHAVVCLRGRGSIQSLNVAATAAILIHALAARRR